MIDPIRSPKLPAVPAAPVRTSPAESQTQAIEDGYSTSLAQETVAAHKLSSLEVKSDEYPRPMNPQEKQMFKSWFPKLDVEEAVVSAPATPRYNCISWTTGNTRSWDWPPSMYPKETPQGAFAKYYSERGFTPISAEDAAKVGGDQELVAYWEDPNGPTHGSVAGNSHGPRWESKCGQAARIQHGRDELESQVYGKIEGYWLKTGESQVEVREIPPETTRRLDAKLALRILQVDPKVAEGFEKAYSQWQVDRSSPAMMMSSNPADYLKSESYEKLVGLGKEALPLWVSKMRQGDFFCQYAVQKLTAPGPDDFQIKGPNLQPELRPQEVRCSEQDKANQVLVQWLDSQW